MLENLFMDNSFNEPDECSRWNPRAEMLCAVLCFSQLTKHLKLIFHLAQKRIFNEMPENLFEKFWKVFEYSKSQNQNVNKLTWHHDGTTPCWSLS